MPEKKPSGSPQQSGGINIEGETSVKGDVTGRDSVTNTTSTTATVSTTATTSTTVTEGGPVAHYAVLGVIGIAALSIIVIALLAFIAFGGGGRPPVPIATATATLTPSAAPSLTATPPPPTATRTPTATFTVPPTETPSPTATATREATATEPVTPTSSPSPTATEPVTPTASPSSTATQAPSPTPTATPFPTTAVPVYESFSDNCLRTAKWMLDWQWPNPTATPGAPICLDTRPQYMAVDEDRLYVFLGQDDTGRKQTHSLTTAAFGYYKQIEVTVALDKAELFTETFSAAYLSIAASVPRVSGEVDLEVRVEGNNTTGKFGYQITSRLNLKQGGYQTFGTLPYTPGQLVTVAFRVQGNKLTAYVNGQPLAGPFSILAEPYTVTIGYHTDEQTSLDGYFDDVRLAAIRASEIKTAPTPTPIPQ